MHEGPQAAITVRELASVLKRVVRELERRDLGAWNTDGFPTGEKAGTLGSAHSQGGCGLGPK